jgi:hypothetical protein
VIKTGRSVVVVSPEVVVISSSLSLMPISSLHMPAPHVPCPWRFECASAHSTHAPVSYQQYNQPHIYRYVPHVLQIDNILMQALANRTPPRLSIISHSNPASSRSPTYIIGTNPPPVPYLMISPSNRNPPPNQPSPAQPSHPLQTSVEPFA